MILIDTGPLIALFDPKDPDHKACHKTLDKITEPLFTTEAVLTEAFHLLDPRSRGTEGLKQFILQEYTSVVCIQLESFCRVFELMEKYIDCPMDFADATLIVLAEQLTISKVFTLDITDFSVYRVKRGHRHVALKIINI